MTTTLVDALRQRAALEPEREVLRFLADDGDGEPLTCRALELRARAMAALVQERTEPGARVVILLPSGLDYAAAFYGCLFAGAVAVPAYPPESTHPQHLERLRVIIEDAEPGLILAEPEVCAALGPVLGGRSALLTAPAPEPGSESAWRETVLRPDDLAFLQYTSGSTSAPKGVRVSHGNLAANERLLSGVFAATAEDTLVSWLPLFHDMGLISGLLQPIVGGYRCVLMSTRHFLERPLRWLEAISRFRGTISGAPDFAYRLCTERVPAGAVATLDLASWDLAYTAAEPIRADTLDGFVAKFAPAGFRARSVFGAFGLAEGTLLVSSMQRGEGTARVAADAAALAGHRFRPGVGPVVVSCGRELPGHPLRIADPATGAPLPAGEVGEIWASGPSIADGYWRKPAATAASFVEVDGSRWLRTGDLGALHGGELYVTGRLKDMLIVRGQNVYPQDLERAVEQAVPLVRKGRVAAFAVQRDGAEAIGIAAEVGRGRRKQQPPAELAAAIRQAIVAACGEAPAAVALLNPGALPRTTSGKLQRSACRLRLADGSLDAFFLQEGHAGADSYTAPEGPAEAAVSAVWCEVLGLVRVGREDDFFALGGDSVVSIQAVSRLAQRGWEVTPRQLFERPTVRGLAAVAQPIARAQGWTAPAGPLVELSAAEWAALPVAAGELEEVYPAAPMQAGLVLHTLLEPGSGIYLMQNRHRIDGPLDLARHDAAWAAVVARHGALRACFALEGVARPLQLVRKALAGWLRHEDLRGLDGVAQGLRVEAVLQAELDRGLDLQRGPLFLVRLFRLGEASFELVVSYHHAILDAWCVFLLLSEFALAYRALEQGRPLPPAAPAYRDFMAWLLARDPAPARAYWREALAGFATPTPLPADRPFGERRGRSRILDRQLVLTVAEDRALRALASRHRLTLNSFVQAAWALTLHRHGGGSDVLFGVTVAGRPPQLPELQGTLGLFIATIPLRLSLPTGAEAVTVADWLAALQARNLAMREHEHLPLVEIQALSELPPGAALFDSLFVFENAPIDVAMLEEAQALKAEVTQTRTHTNYPITAVAYPHGRLGLHLSCDGRFFDAVTVERLLATFKRALLALVAGFQAPVRALDLLDPAERERLTPPLTPRPPELGQGWAALFRDVAARHGGRTAAACQGASLSYAALDAAGNRVAQALLARGVRPDAVVAVLAGRGLGYLTGVVGALKAGAGFLGLDPAWPPARLGGLLADARPQAVLVAERDRPLLAGLRELPPLLVLEEIERAGLPASDPRVPVGPHHLGYLIHTSGSTGVPKGVLVEQAGMLGNQLSKHPWLGLTPDDVIAQTAGHGFDVAVWQLLGGLLGGARVEILPDAVAHDPAALLESLATCGITVLEAVPAVIAGLLDAGPVPLPSLRWLMPTGEALPPGLARRWLERYPAIPLVNAYGPAECSDDVALQRIATPPPGDAVLVPVGGATAHNRLYVLDEALELLPEGAAGELWVAGIGVARGYLGDPARTATRFLPDPFAGDGGRIYRTGDRARWNAEGQLECLGRIDRQLKLRGQRIEPGEIEARLREHGEVCDAAVALDPAGIRLMAWIVAPGAAPDLPARLRARLAEQLPAHLVPATIHPLATLPRTKNGKLDTQALPTETTPSTHTPPRTDTEHQLAQIWSDVLGKEQIGRNDDFLQLGGNSLLATQVVSRVRQRLGLDLELRSLFDAPVLADFARAVEDAPRRLVPSVELASTADEGPARLSFAQQRMWFLWRLDPASPAHNVAGALRLRGPLDVAALRRTFATLVARHEVLRTTVVVVAGQPVALVQPPAPPALPLEDLSGLPASEREGRLAAVLDAEAHRPFDLATAPPLRLLLVRLAPQEHVLALTQHHIATDAWSIDLLLGEITTHYPAFCAGREPELAPLQVRYVDYAAWQRSWLASGEGRRQLAYWTALLGDAAEPLDLPLDRPRPARRDHAGGRVDFLLPDGVAAGLRRIADAERTTISVVLLAAFVALLRRHGCQEDLRVGVPTTGRNRIETERVVGLFVNTLVIRAPAPATQGFTAMVRRVRDAMLAAQANQDLPFDQLVEALQPDRSLGHHPLFQVMFNYLQLGALAIREIGGLQVDLIERELRAQLFDLALTTQERPGGGIAASLGFATDVFDRATVERLGARLLRLLTEVGKEPDRPLGAVPLLLAGEGVRLVAGSAGDAALETLLGGVWDAPAVVCGDAVVGRAELSARAGRLAGRLRAAGVGPEVVVAVALARGPRLLESLLGVLMAGGAYLPLDPDFPAERLAFMLADSGARLLLTERHLRAALPQVAEVWCLDEPAEAPDAPGWRVVDARHPAYLIYTSGSTGRPKGVVVSRGALANFLQGMAQAPGLASGERLLALTSLSFDIAALELFLPLAAGGTVVLVGREEARDPALLAAAIARHDVRAVQATPSTWRMLAVAGRLPVLAGRRVLCGGEALPPDLARDLIAQAAEVWNLYGPTETTVWSAVARLDAAAPEPVLGGPVAATALLLLGAELEPVPPGVTGELFIGGAGLARGYHGRPGLTAERFVPDPDGKGARLYRTGDRVRRRPDGGLDYRGRADQQVKLRGHRIEPGEIEAALLAHPLVREAAVVVRSGPQLVAYVVAEPAALQLAGRLKAHLQASLPEHLIPGHIQQLDRFPLTPNRKLDRNALPEPEAQAPASRPPVTPTEAALAAIWRELLAVEAIGAEANFFELGGHSLLATQLIARVRDRFGVELPLRAVFETRTLADLASAVAGATAAAPAWLAAADGSGTQDLSSAQARLWFFAQLEPQASLYNVAGAVRLTGPLDLAALRHCCDRLVERHPTLRTRFEEAEEPRQVVMPAAGVALAVEDLSHLAAGVREEAARARAEEEARLPFDLTHGPLLRFRLLRMAPAEHILMLTLHHVAVDGWSIKVLVEEFEQLYAARRRGEVASLPEPTVQYTDFVRWQRDHLATGAAARQLAYWRERLGEDLSVLELPADRPRAPGGRQQGVLHRFALEADLAARVRACAQASGVTLFMLLLAAFAVVLHERTGRRRVRIGGDAANRNDARLERLVGFFVNQVVLQVDVDPAATVPDLLDQCRRVVIGAAENQDLPFNRLVEALRPPRRAGRSPLFSIKLIHQEGDDPLPRLPGLTVEPYAAGATAAELDLVVSFENGAETIKASFQCPRDLFAPATIAGLLAQMQAVLEALASGKAASVADLVARAAAQSPATSAITPPELRRVTRAALRRAS